VFCDPCVLECLLGSYPPFWVLRQQALDQVDCVGRDKVPVFDWEFEFCFTDCVRDQLVVVPVERRVPAQHDIHDHSNRPDIALLIVLPLQDLWRDVVRRPADVLESLIPVLLLRRPKIDHFERGISARLVLIEDVLRL
jgi:hypothetical protein